MVVMYVAPLAIIIFAYASIYYEIFQKSRIQNSGEFIKALFSYDYIYFKGEFTICAMVLIFLRKFLL